MNLDFHYYGTYVAARLAGYDFDSACTIAHAAQYVDDSDEGMLEESGNYFIKDFTPVPTVQGMGDMLEDNFNWSETVRNGIADVWVPFHFLPGNYGDGMRLQQYSGPGRDRGTLFRWTFDQESENQFKLLCQPNSLLAGEMVNDIVQNHADKAYTLQMTGLRMHVLADTWAHMFYIGLPAWFVNDAHEEVFEINGTTERPVTWQRLWPWGDSTDIINGESATPDMPSYNSVVYLGHGRMGHLPDYPYLSYKYTPRWSATPITKDNSVYFLNAFKQLTRALKCIRTKSVFNVEEYEILDTSVESIIWEILETRENDQSQVWRDHIGRIKVNGQPLELPGEYDKTAWLEAFKAGDTRSDYYHFNKSACLHLELVRKSLETHDIYFDRIPRERIVSAKFKCKNQYIGALEKSSITRQYYPRMQNQSSAINIEIIKQHSGPLTSGDIVEIRTVEPNAGDYNFLGAWETKALYYYTKAYDISKQKWQIEKVETGGSDTIEAGNRVRFKNIHFTDVPYMCTYDYALGGTYLTTQADGSADNAIWSLWV